MTGAAPAERPQPTHVATIRVYYEDTDVGGVVYYANYLKFFERARSEMLRAAGVDQARLLAEEGFGFVVRRCATDFFAAARYDDLLEVDTVLQAVGGARLDLRQTARRAGEARALVAADVVVALVDRAGKPRRLPDDLRAKLVAVEGAN